MGSGRVEPASTDWVVTQERLNMAFQDQLDRSVRWYERFRDLTHGREHTMGSENYADEIFAFFQNCYHLKDWIQNDTQVPPSMAAGVWPAVNQSVALELCADLCNSQKHFTLNRPPQSGSVPISGPKHWGLALGVGEHPIINLKVEIQSGSQVLDGFTVATDAMRDWTAFINAHGYSVQAPSPHLPSPRSPPMSPGNANQVPGALIEMRAGKIRMLASAMLLRLADGLIGLGNSLNRRV